MGGADGSSEPPHRLAAAWAAPRCAAKCKRTGERCRGPAMRGKRVCRSHGGKGGARKGNRNALKHGRRSRGAIAEAREATTVLRSLRDLVATTQRFGRPV